MTETMCNIYKQVSDERYALLTTRYQKFQMTMDDATLEPVRVFDPLQQKQIDELYLIREVSKDLQKKKEEDMNKAALQQAEAEKKEVEEPAVETEEKKDV